MQAKLLRFAEVALLSFAGAFACALLFVRALMWSLPPTDWAYGESFAMTLRDPFVLAGIVIGAGLSGLITAPLAYFCLRGRSLLRCAGIVFAATAAEILLATPWFGWAAWHGAYVVLAVALLCCRWTRERSGAG